MRKSTAAVAIGRKPDIVEAMNHPGMFGQWFSGESWFNWRTILKGAFALPLDDAEREFFRSVTGREPPRKRVKELWIIGGRRSGKDSIASLIIAWMATFFSSEGRLRPGERALCQLLAVNREQSEIVLNLVRPYFRDIPPLRELVVNETDTGLLLSNGVEITIQTNSFRGPRGTTALLSIFDECGFWNDDRSARPDEETYRAIKPSMMTLPESMLIAISTPWRQSGLLWRKFDQHYGRDDDRILVVRAPSTVLNPLLDVSEVQEALEADPTGGAAEWLAEFRADLESFLSREVIAAVVDKDRPLELPPRAGHGYVGFIDGAEGGPNGDSFTAAVAHLERGQNGNDLLVLDAVRETRAPFVPTQVIETMVLPLFKAYGVRRVKADRHAEGFIKDICRNGGLMVEPDALPKSDIYREMLPWLNSKRVQLPNFDRLLNQIQGLERGPNRGGRETIDHARGGRDDIVNAAFGAMLEAAMHAPLVISKEFLQKVAALPPRRPLYANRHRHLAAGLEGWPPPQ